MSMIDRHLLVSYLIINPADHIFQPKVEIESTKAIERQREESQEIKTRNRRRCRVRQEESKAVETITKQSS